MTAKGTGTPARGGGAVERDRERHPVAKLGETIGRLPRYLALAGALLRDPGLPRWRKGALGAGLVYVASPIDLVPGVIPVAGQLDDLAALLLALRVALRGCPADVAEAHLRSASLSHDDFDRDLANVRGAAAWIGRNVVRGSIRVGKASLRGAGHLIAFGADRAGRIAGAAMKRPS